MTDESAFQSALDADPTSAATRLVFADWMEEQGDARAAGYRWLGENGKWPQPPLNPNAKYGVVMDYSWTWYRNRRARHWCEPCHLIPAKYHGKIFSYMNRGGALVNSKICKCFRSRRHAEDAFCNAMNIVISDAASKRIIQLEVGI